MCEISMPTQSAYFGVYVSKKDQFACTPPSLLKQVCQIYFNNKRPYDPCPSKPTFDGLNTAWRKYNFVNPPFSKTVTWVRKAVDEAQNTVLLMPVRSAAAYVHQEILPVCKSIVLLCNPVCFPPHIKPLPTPIMLVNFGGSVQLRSTPFMTLH